MKRRTSEEDKKYYGTQKLYSMKRKKMGFLECEVSTHNRKAECRVFVCGRSLTSRVINTDVSSRWDKRPLVLLAGGKIHNGNCLLSN